MDFNSLEFVAFVAAFFLFWPLVRKNNTARWTYLTVSSLFFYSWGFSKYVWLLLLTGLIDYSAGIAMERFPHRTSELRQVNPTNPAASTLIGNGTYETGYWIGGLGFAWIPGSSEDLGPASRTLDVSTDVE